MDVGINKEPNPRRVLVSHTKTTERERGLPSQFQETPNHIGDSLVLLLQVPGVLNLGARRKLFSSGRPQTQSEIDSRRLSLQTPISAEGECAETKDSRSVSLTLPRRAQKVPSTLQPDPRAVRSGGSYGQQALLCGG